MAFSPRASFMCVQPFLDLVHGKSSHYQVAGREIRFTRPDFGYTRSDVELL
jgi:hypothetical protein